MVAHPLPSLAAPRTRKNVKADLGPVRNALRYLDCFVLGMICGIHAVRGVLRTWQRLRSIHSEVAVQLEHRRLRGYCVRTIYLNLIIVLSPNTSAKRDEQHEINGGTEQPAL